MLQDIKDGKYTAYLGDNPSLKEALRICRNEQAELDAKFQADLEKEFRTENHPDKQAFFEWACRVSMTPVEIYFAYAEVSASTFTLTKDEKQLTQQHN